MKNMISKIIYILLIVSITIFLPACNYKNSNASQLSADQLIENENDSSDLDNPNIGQSSENYERVDNEIVEKNSEENVDITLEELAEAMSPEEAFSGNNSDEAIFFLGKDEATDTYIYSINTGNIVLRKGDEIRVLEDRLGGPQFIEPTFGFYDYDGDGDIEFALSTLRDIGSSCLKTELSVYEIENGIYERRSPDYMAFIEGATLFYTSQIEDDKIYDLGEIYETEVMGDTIEVTFHVGCVEKGKAVPEFDEGELVKAEIIYNADGSFVLSNTHLSQ